LLVSKNGDSHSHYLHVAFVSILVFRTFDRIIFGALTFPGTRWYVLTVRDPQMVRDQKKFGNHCSSPFLFQRCREAPYKSFALNCAFFSLSNLMNHSGAAIKKLGTKSYVFQNKPKIISKYAKKAHQQFYMQTKNILKLNDLKQFTM